MWQECISDELHDLPTLEDLDVNLVNLEDRARYLLRNHIVEGYYEEAVGEFAMADPPPRYNPDSRPDSGLTALHS